MTAAAKIAEALLPCPYCGSVTRISGFSKRIGKATPTVFQTAQVKCKRQSCGMSGPLAKGDGCRAMAVDTFNAVARRAKRADALAQEIAKLRSALHDTEDRIERASDLCHNAQDWFNVDDAVFHGVSIFDWIMSPARAALTSDAERTP